jgi:hypothetical protein
MTLHFHKVDDITMVYDNDEPRRVPAGWQIAGGSADDVRVCGAHAWQTTWLIFANGNACGTAANSDYSRRGAPHRCGIYKLQKLHFCLMPENRGDNRRRLS